MFLEFVLLANAFVIAGSIGVAFKYYFAARELHQAIHKQSEADGARYAQSFQAQLWQERKTELERELSAFQKAHEKTSLELAEMTDRFNGMEQAYHELKDEFRTAQLRKIDRQSKKKPKGDITQK